MEEIKLTKMEKMIIKSYLKEAANNITKDNKHEHDYREAGLLYALNNILKKLNKM